MQSLIYPVAGDDIDGTGNTGDWTFCQVDTGKLQFFFSRQRVENGNQEEQVQRHSDAQFLMVVDPRMLGVK